MKNAVFAITCNSLNVSEKIISAAQAMILLDGDNIFIGENYRCITFNVVIGFDMFGVPFAYAKGKGIELELDFDEIYPMVSKANAFEIKNRRFETELTIPVTGVYVTFKVE